MFTTLILHISTSVKFENNLTIIHSYVKPASPIFMHELFRSSASVLDFSLLRSKLHYDKAKRKVHFRAHANNASSLKHISSNTFIQI